MTDIGKRLRQLRTDRGLTQDEVSNSLGISKPTIFKYESGIITNIPSDRIEDLANLYDVSPAYIMGWEDISGQEKTSNSNRQPGRLIPIVGTIAAGNPILAEEHIESYIRIDDSVNADFGLRVKGDSMINAHILDGDIALIRKQETLETGEIGAILIGEEATLKTFRRTENMITLFPENSEYDPIFIEDKEASFQENNVKILGKYVGLFRNKEK